MSPAGESGPGEGGRRVERSRRDVFGQVLPERTRDEEREGWGEVPYDEDERLRREVPPHHG